MYLKHFGLKAQPFQLTPDIGFLFMSEAHTRAKAYMDYTVWNREGFVVITGEIGCGKTTLIQKVLSELDENVVVAKIFQTQLDEVEFLQAMLVDFGLSPFNSKEVKLLDMLNTFLLEQLLQGKQIVLIVDDAHNLSTKVLEEIRMLSGLETRKEKILHVILVGQPQLNDIPPLSEQELSQYILFRLSAAGAADRMLFLPETFHVVYKYTGGTPRLINTLCDAALTCAYADNLRKIAASVVEAAAGELQWPPYAERVNQRRQNLAPSPFDSGLHDVLSEHSRSLATIAEQAGKLEDLLPMLASIRTSLAAIETSLRELVQSRAGDPNSGPASSRFKSAR